MAFKANSNLLLKGSLVIDSAIDVAASGQIQGYPSILLTATCDSAVVSRQTVERSELLLTQVLFTRYSGTSPFLLAATNNNS